MEHWDEVYRRKPSTTVSWYQPSPEPSLGLLDRFAPSGRCSLIDVGGGASNLVDKLLERGWSNLTVLDIAAPALEVAKSRLGQAAERVDWQVADITTWHPPHTYDIWHDRAVFHFLTSDEDREAYKRALAAGTKSGGLAIFGTFSLDGPEKCSGLDVQRYSSETLVRELGPDYKLLEASVEKHETPGGNEQAFNWCVFRRNR